MAKLYAKAPDGSDALLSIVITGFTQSLQQNGWCKLPNGLLFQWPGHFRMVSGDPRIWTFPLSINEIYSILMTMNDTSLRIISAIVRYNNLSCIFDDYPDSDAYCFGYILGV